MEQGLAHTTICAVATPGNGALAIIRVSGKEAFQVTQKIFRPAKAGKKLEDQPGNTIHFGAIMDGNELVDEVLVSVFRAPHSYTGEHSVEISCHGSRYIEQKIIQLLLESGAVAARPGEFTQRAFLHGKMDLSQAEAVADVIASETKAAHDVAIRQMRGGFSQKVKELRDRLLHFISMIELELDFSEEDVEFADREALMSLVKEVKSLTDRLMNSFYLGNVLKNGVPVAIVGKPNVGKSTLLNALLREDKAIVSEIEGTTRDSIEDTVNIEGVVFRFIDTAGIRETADTIENLGIRRTYQKINSASIVLLLVDATDPEDIIVLSVETLRGQLQEDQTLVVVINKSDLAGPDTLERKKSAIPAGENEHIVAISAGQDHGSDELTTLLTRLVHAPSAGPQDVIISNIRHYHALKASSESLERVIEGIETRLPEDLLAQDIREVLHYLGEITGEVTTDEILGNIFKNFCIGK